MTATRDQLPVDPTDPSAGNGLSDEPDAPALVPDATVAVHEPARATDVLGSPAARKLAWAFVATAAVLAVVLYNTINLRTPVGQVITGVVPAVPAGVFGWLALRSAAELDAVRRRFWRIVSVGVGFVLVAQLARAALGASGMPSAQVTLYQSIGYAFALGSFCVALVVRLRWIAADLWRLQALDATAIAVVAWSAVGVVTLSLTERETGLGQIVYLSIPALVTLLVIGIVSVLITPTPNRNKRVEWILGAALLLGAFESWLEVAAFRTTGDTVSVATAIVITVAWLFALPAPLYEVRHPDLRPALEIDTASPWPYVALGVQPLLALWSVAALQIDAQIVAIVGLVAVFAVSVARQIEVLNAQQEAYDAEVGLSDVISRDVTAAQTMLALSRRLAASTSARAAEAAVLAAVRDATGAAHVWVERRPGGAAASLTVAVADDGERRRWRVPVPDADGRPFATLVVDDADRTDGRALEVDTDLLARIAGQYGAAVERARLVRELERARIRLSGIVDHLPSGVCEVDHFGRIATANVAFATVCDRPLHRVVGRPWTEAFSMVTPDLATVRDRLAKGETVSGEGVIRSAAGMRKTVEYLLCPIGVAGDVIEGQPIDLDAPGRYLGVLRDVTDQRTQRMRIVRLYQELQAKTRARAELLGKVVSSAEDERRNLAADIHDGPVQTLTALGLRLDTLRVMLQSREPSAPWPQPTLAELGAIRADLAHTVDVVRSFMTGLRPPELDAGGIGSALRALCRRFETGAGPRVVCDVESLPPSVPEFAEIVAYRVAQEALQNVARHAHAKECLVVCGVRGAELVLEIVDDGVGSPRVDPEVLDDLAAAGHFGVATMAERVALAGGRFELGPGPRGGTRIVATIPLELA